jgi:nucleoside 2-deoxyribosyltransferase
MKLYIAASSKEKASIAAEILKQKGHEITSSWLNAPFLSTSEYSIQERREIANGDYEDIGKADALVLIADEYKVAGGKFVEAGIAIGMHKTVYLIGDEENMLMYHWRVVKVSSVLDIK